MAHLILIIQIIIQITTHKIIFSWLSNNNNNNNNKIKIVLIIHQFLENLNIKSKQWSKLIASKIM